ncbi:MAG: T9SS type A sorting domain-containing protein [Ignavibacteria bacterium]|nr:T9SS type A sorting domain-containing protein [Ignavibacteria bacterium]
MKNLYLTFFLSIILAGISTNQLKAQWTDGQNAEYVIGQPDFTTYTSGSATNKLNGARYVAIDLTNNKLYVADLYNHRVLRFAYPISGNQPTAERVFGTGSSSFAQNTTPYPVAVAVYNGTLYVCQQDGDRITKFNNAHTASSDGPAADGVLGQSDYTGNSSGVTQSKFWNPYGICIDGSGNLWVADMSNNRVLKFNDISSKSNGANADLVLGQATFTTNTSGTTQSTFNSPYDVTVSGTTVWVADGSNNRVLRFDNPTTSGVGASGVLGQSAYNTSSSGLSSTTFYSLNYVCIDGAGRLYVSDFNNTRIMIFNNASSKSNGAAADNVLGQPNFITNNTYQKGQNGFYYDSDMEAGSVYGVAVDATNNKLLVVDADNNRIMQFAASSPLPVELTSFTSTITNNQVVLNWKTATEVENYGFEVESRVNSPQSSVGSQSLNDWAKIGFVQGHGNSNSPKNYSYTDNLVSPTGKYLYRLKQIDNNGKFTYSNVVNVDIENIPTDYTFYQNYPNPFNPTTTIKFGLPKEGIVTLEVYNLIGEKVATLVNKELTAGYHSIDFNGSSLSSGIYLYKLAVGEFTSTKKFVLMK